jgi:hypothetical protein
MSDFFKNKEKKRKEEKEERGENNWKIKDMQCL